MKKITAWTKIEPIKDEEGNLIGENKNFNHISDGWSDTDYPLPVKESYTNQKAWAQMKWEKRNAYLNENYQVIYK